MEEVTYESCKAEVASFSKWRINRNIIFLKILIPSLSTLGLWIWDIIVWSVIWSSFVFLKLLSFNLITVSVFVVIHLFYWKFFGSENAKELQKDVPLNKIHIMYQALVDTKREKYSKNK